MTHPMLNDPKFRAWHENAGRIVVNVARPTPAPRQTIGPAELELITRIEQRLEELVAGPGGLVANAGEWVEYPVVNVSQLERARNFISEGMLNQLQAIAAGEFGPEMEASLPELRSKLAGLLAQMDETIVTIGITGDPPDVVHNNAGGEWVEYFSAAPVQPAHGLAVATAGDGWEEYSLT